MNRPVLSAVSGSSRASQTRGGVLDGPGRSASFGPAQSPSIDVLRVWSRHLLPRVPYGGAARASRFLWARAKNTSAPISAAMAFVRSAEDRKSVGEGK